MIKHGTITRLRTASIKESVSRFVNHERNSFGCATHVPSLPDIIFHMGLMLKFVSPVLIILRIDQRNTCSLAFEQGAPVCIIATLNHITFPLKV